MSASDLLSAFPAREGHFLLESGYHSNLWLTLDALFVDQNSVAPFIGALAEKLRPYNVSAVCGPLLGGAFLALALAPRLAARFFFSTPSGTSQGLFKAEYVLTAELSRRIRGERVALVDDAISAGSSVRATKAALDLAGASTVVVGALVTLGTIGREYFAKGDVPVETLEYRDLAIWKPGECPLCQVGEALVDPRTSW